MSPIEFPVRRTIAVVALLAAALTAACGGEEEPDYSGDATADDARPVSLTANDFSFTPAKLTAGSEDSFQVVLTNAGDAPHTFTIDEFDVDAEVAAGEEMTVSVTPSDSGDYAFYCRFHRDQGMEGDITVSGAAGDLETASGPTQAPTDDSYYDY